MKPVTIERNTRETQIALTLDISRPNEKPEIATGLPFVDHMLTAMSYHGGFTLAVKATGDIEVDPHHLVEDLGIVLGMAIHKAFDGASGLQRYGSSSIPMDDALSQVNIDLCNRPYLVYQADFPQPAVGTLDIALFKEFFVGLAANARINLHARCLYGENSHHMIEALFKALGKALAAAFAPGRTGSSMSTKGSL